MINGVNGVVSGKTMIDDEILAHVVHDDGDVEHIRLVQC